MNICIAGRLLRLIGSHPVFTPGLLCFVPLSLVACHRSAIREPAISVHQQLSPQPVRTGHSKLAIQLADAEQKPVSHAIIKVEADMAHPGMAPVFGKAEETGPGTYSAPIDLNMAGDWVVALQITLPSGEKIERQMDVRGVQPN